MHNTLLSAIWRKKSLMSDASVTGENCKHLKHFMTGRTIFFDKWTLVNDGLGWIRKEEILKIFVFLSLCRSGRWNYTSHSKSMTIFHESCTLKNRIKEETVVDCGGVTEKNTSAWFVKWLSVNFYIREWFLFNWIISFRFWLVPRVDKINEIVLYCDGTRTAQCFWVKTMECALKCRQEGNIVKTLKV